MERWLLLLWLLVRTARTLEPETRPTEEVPSTHIPHVLSAPETEAVRPGQHVEFPCEIDELGNFAKIWRKDGELYFTNDYRFIKDQRISLTERQGLRIGPVVAEDRGEYLCQISSEPVLELRHRLVVVVAPVVRTVPADGQLTVGLGQNFSLGCEATGLPELSLVWTHSEDTSLEEVRRGNYLVVPAAEDKHAGQYRCTVSNGYDQPVAAWVRVSVVPVEDINNEELVQTDTKHDTTPIFPKEFEVEATPHVDQSRPSDGNSDDGNGADHQVHQLLELPTLLVWLLLVIR